MRGVVLFLILLLSAPAYSYDFISVKCEKIGGEAAIVKGKILGKKGHKLKIMCLGGFCKDKLLVVNCKSSSCGMCAKFKKGAVLLFYFDGKRVQLLKGKDFNKRWNYERMP